MDFNLSEVMNSSEILNESFELSPQQGGGGIKPQIKCFIIFVFMYIFY